MNEVMGQDERVLDYIQTGIELYRDLLEDGMPKEEARQILCNAQSVNLLMTWNVRSLINLVKIRCCNRNVMEMRVFANKVLLLLWKFWPELAACLGPACETGKCNQGKMMCDAKTWEPTA